MNENNGMSEIVSKSCLEASRIKDQASTGEIATADTGMHHAPEERRTSQGLKSWIQLDTQSSIEPREPGLVSGKTSSGPWIPKLVATVAQLALGWFAALHRSTTISGFPTLKSITLHPAPWDLEFSDLSLPLPRTSAHPLRHHPNSSPRLCILISDL